jgi:hypothetical protein
MWTYWEFGVWDDGAQAYGLAHLPYGSLFMSLALYRDFSQVDFRQVAGANTVSIWLQDQGCLPPYTYYMADGYVFGTEELWYPPYYEEYEDYFWEGDWTPGPGVRVDSADIPSDNVTVTLWPCGGNGPLTVQFERDGGVTHQIFQGDREGGSHSFSFDIQNLPNGQEFTRVRATWQPNSVPPESDTLDYHFKVLGDYNNTQYNTPTESFCSSGTNVTLQATGPGTCTSVANCNFTNPQARSQFWNEVAENGGGLSQTIGVVSLEWYCCARPDQQQCVRRVDAPCAACSGMTLVPGSSVAVMSLGGDTPCGATLYVDGVGVANVADRGGGLGDTQLDHYIGFGGCNRYGGAIGTRKVIRLY